MDTTPGPARKDIFELSRLDWQLRCQQSGRIEACWSPDGTQAFLDVEDGTWWLYERDHEVMHNRYGGEVYYRSRSGLTGEGYFPADAPLVRVGCYDAQRPWLRDEVPVADSQGSKVKVWIPDDPEQFGVVMAFSNGAVWFTDRDTAYEALVEGREPKLMQPVEDHLTVEYFGRSFGYGNSYKFDVPWHWDRANRLCGPWAPGFSWLASEPRQAAEDLQLQQSDVWPHLHIYRSALDGRWYWKNAYGWALMQYQKPPWEDLDQPLPPRWQWIKPGKEAVKVRPAYVVVAGPDGGYVLSRDQFLLARVRDRRK